MYANTMNLVFTNQEGNFVNGNYFSGHIFSEICSEGVKTRPCIRSPKSSFSDPLIFWRFHRTINKTLYNLKIITRLKKLTLLKKIFIYYEYKIECSPMF